MSQATITGGSHKGKHGIIVSHTSHFTRVDIGGSVVRCKKEFITIVPDIVPVPQQPVPQQPVPQQPVPQKKTNEEMIHEQEMILQEIQKANERKKQNAHISQMISAQNKEYEESVKQDMETQAKVGRDIVDTPVFEEVSMEEMRQVRLKRFA